MSDEPFVMMSLKEGKAKKMTQVLSNETARKILEYLSGKKEATETQIANDLKIPLSTTHYNLRQLAQNKLVTEDEYHYSDKGKEVIHYKIAKKYIIIAPMDEDETMLSKLKSFLPIFLLIVAASGLVGLLQGAFYNDAGLYGAGRGLDYDAFKVREEIGGANGAADAGIADGMMQKTAEASTDEAAPLLAAVRAPGGLNESLNVTDVLGVDNATIAGAEINANDTADAIPYESFDALPETAPLARAPNIARQMALWFFLGGIFVLALIL